jgi:hypothetical protein
LTASLRAGLATLALVATVGTAQGGDCSGEIAGAALTDAQEVVRRLYETPSFVEPRNDIDEAAIGELEPYLTDRLTAALRDFSAALSRVDQAADVLSKSPYPTGPIFYSNYEGMDQFRIGPASPGEDQTVHVAVELDFESGLGNASWTDVAVMRCERDGWKLDDIVFDPSQTAGPSLSERIVVR